MSVRFVHLLILLAAGATLAACGSSRQIIAQPPVSGIERGGIDTSSGLTFPLTIVLQTGASALEKDVATLRFQVDSVGLKSPEQAWRWYPADRNLFEISAGHLPERIILSTRVPESAYDSLALSFQDVYVQFNPHAGAPLTAGEHVPLTLPARIAAEGTGRQMLTLVLEPGPSVTRSADCRWYFVPFVVDEDPAAQP